MTLTQRIFVLKGVPGFDQLRDEELLAVSASMTERRFAPNAVVLSAGASVWHLLVVIEGHVRVQRSREAVPQVIGADLILTNRRAAETLVADDREGAVCLRMSKGHFFTIVNECPALLVEMTRLHVIGHTPPAVLP